MDEVVEAADNVEGCQIIAALPHTEKLQHERAVVFPCAVDLILSAKSQTSINQMCNIPRVVKPGSLSGKVTVILVVPIQWATVKAYFNQKGLKCHC